jgi:hypothetical protein
MRPVIMVGSILGASMFGISAFLSSIYSVMILFGLIGGFQNKIFLKSYRFLENY